MILNDAIKGNDPKTIYLAISDKVNNYFIDYSKTIKDITEDPRAEKRFLALSLLWVTACAKDAEQRWAYDDRNAYSVKICAKLAQTGLFRNGTPHGYIADPEHTAQKAVDLLRDMHRTLKQTFSSLVFRYLLEKAKEDLNLREAVAELDQEYGAGWERCPLI